VRPRRLAAWDGKRGCSAPSSPASYGAVAPGRLFDGRRGLGARYRTCGGDREDGRGAPPPQRSRRRRAWRTCRGAYGGRARRTMEYSLTTLSKENLSPGIARIMVNRRDQSLFVITRASDKDRDHAVRVENLMESETSQCDVFSTVEMRRISPLAVADIRRVRNDFVWTWYLDLLASENGRAWILSRQISGVTLSSATVVGANNSPYWEVLVNGFAGFVKQESKVRIRDRCDACGLYSYAFETPFARLIDMAKWDGSDVFTVWPFPGVYICTGKVATAISQSEITGIVPVPIEEFDVRHGHAAPGSPTARLSDANQARLLADPDYRRLIASS
jgi:hypothetical protein